MKKMKLTLVLLMITVIVACGQKAQVFDKVATFNAGFRFSPTGTIFTSDRRDG
jgi:DNA-binding transcriptional regulator of glucitol operon